MNTTDKKIMIKSIGLMTGQDCEVTLIPSDKKGIHFHIGDKTIDANIDNVISTEHCVVIGNNEIKIVLIEHFMAACAICNIDALDVYLTHYEMPILDGSSKEWVRLFKENGFCQNITKKYSVKEPVSYLNGKTHIVVMPSDELRITYSVNFNHKDLASRWVSYNSENLDEIMEARTFGYLKDLEMLQKSGYARGVSIENTVGLTDDGYTTELRSEYEPAKHKILDLLGDFYLIGINPLSLNAEIIVKEAGHAVHTKVAKILKDKFYEVM